MHQCTGKRGRTDFVPIEDFSDGLLVRDYQFLEEISREEDSSKRGFSHRAGKPTGKAKLLIQKALALSAALRVMLVVQAKERGTQLMIMPGSFSRHKQNTTAFSKK